MVGILMIIPNTNQEKYDKVMEKLGLSEEGGDWPEGIIGHMAGPSGNDWIVVDTWNSKEDFNKFFEERLKEAIEEAGFPNIEPKFFDIYLSHMSKL